MIEIQLLEIEKDNGIYVAQWKKGEPYFTTLWIRNTETNKFDSVTITLNDATQLTKFLNILDLKSRLEIIDKGVIDETSSHVQDVGKS